MGTKKIQATKNYRMFERSSDNRPMDIKKHRKLEQSMKTYGFLQCFPIVVRRNEKGKLIIKDGQHRLSIAESLNLTVYWVEEEVDFDIAEINSTSKTWQLRDYAQKYAANGIKDYQEGIEFADQHHLNIGTSFALLAGTVSFSNINDQFIDGTWKIKDRPWADAVAGIYAPMVEIAPAIKNARFIEACMGCCRIKEFDAKRLIRNAGRCREKLVSYSTKDAFLDMIEHVYNFGHTKLLGIKALATMEMRGRNLGGKIASKGKKEAA